MLEPIPEPTGQKSEVITDPDKFCLLQPEYICTPEYQVRQFFDKDFRQ